MVEAIFIAVVVGTCVYLLTGNRESGPKVPDIGWASGETLSDSSEDME